ncbi:MAG TPA: type I DNA topoisomerase [Acidimicrobiales bacterium]|nr:type I DNA topoisomerase [Acidimicrobiales bacterium]
MAKPLVIVESPAKAKTIAGFLGSEYMVESSIGHIRDLPRNAADVPTAYKGEAWARLGVDTENDFKPLYVVAPEKKAQVSKLKSLLKDASEVYLATDEDREGESIAWHLLEVLNPRVPVRRMVFHEITRPAIERAVREWRDLDRRLVDAQETRRILDRLYGYEVSPVLWRKVMPRLSAGRVQSVATRMLVDRERARMRFHSADWWDIEGLFEKEGDTESFPATLSALDGKRLASGRDFEESGQLKTDADVVRLDEAAATDLARRLENAKFEVASVDERPFTRRPYAPFITSTLQQEAGRKLRFSSARTMQVAQRLYENGFITYMRTDSTTLSETAVTAARRQIETLYGKAYLPDAPRRYEKKVKNAQEAHEAIRPAGDDMRTPESLGAQLHGDEARLYDLIWKRTIASQMSDARGTSAQVRIVGRAAAGAEGKAEEATFAASGKIIQFPGFMRAYVEGADDPDAELEDKEIRLPSLAQGDALTVVDTEAGPGLDPRSHATQPPARYTEASLIKALEEMGVGRPSTYTSIISTIQDRGYVWKKGSALVPSFTALAVVGLLEEHFGDLVDYGFTAAMEDDLDEIAGGSAEAVPYLRRFYFGAERPGLKALVSDDLDRIDAREVNSIPIGQTPAGETIYARVGRYGPYVQNGEERASIPEDMAPDELTVERAQELLAAPSGDRTIGTDPASGLPVVARAGRFGPYVQLGEVDSGSKERPLTASLFKTMALDTVTLDDALRLLSLPRVVGTDPADNAEIEALNGRYGPYLKKGTDTRSLASEEDLFTVSLEEALALFAQPKTRGRAAAAAPLKELGSDPVSGKPMVVKSGRFGPYVTDGETNASLRKGDEPESLTDERAAELLADRRAAGPAKKRAGRAGAARKSTGTAKKAGARKTAAKKTAAKKTAAKKTAAKKPPSGTSD